MTQVPAASVAAVAAELLASPHTTAEELEAALERVVSDSSTEAFARAFGPRRLMKALASGRLTERGIELADQLLSGDGVADGLAPSLEFTEVLHREELFPDEVVTLTSTPPPPPPACSDEHRMLLHLDGSVFLPSAGCVVRDLPPLTAADAADASEATAEQPAELRLLNPSRRYRLGSEIGTASRSNQRRRAADPLAGDPDSSRSAPLPPPDAPCACLPSLSQSARCGLRLSC